MRFLSKPMSNLTVLYRVLFHRMFSSIGFEHQGL